MVMKFVFLLLFSCVCVLSGRAQQYIESVLPYRLVGGKMIVEMKMNGQMRSFIFDTGGQTALTEELCKELELSVFDSLKITDVNGKEGGYKRVLIQELTDSETRFSFKDVPAIVIPAPSPFVCFQVDGLIGSDLLKYLIVEIDGKNKIIKLIATDRSATPSLRKMLPFAKSGIMPVIHLQAGRDNLLTLFDTGFPGFLSLKKTDARVLKERNALHFVDEGYGEGGIGLGGMAMIDTLYRVELPVLSIGPAKFFNVSAETSTPPYTLLGVKVLEYGKVTIDYPRSRFYFEPYEMEKQDLRESYYDFGLRVKDGDLVVSTVWSGLKGITDIGDKVMRINGNAVGKYDFCESVITGIPELKKKKKNKLLISTKDGEKVIIYKKRLYGK